MNLSCPNSFFGAERVLALTSAKGSGDNRKLFFAKLNIALKEADETAYWIELLHESGYLTEEEFKSIYADNDEIIRLLVSITKKQKSDAESAIPHS